MSEIVADDGDVDARLQQGDGAAVPKNVGTDAGSPQNGMSLRRAARVFLEQVRDAVARKFFAAPTAEDSARAAICWEERGQCGRGLGPQWADPLLAAFSEQPDVVRARELEVALANADRLADARPGVVQEQQQSVIPSAERRRAVGLREERGDDLGLPIGHGSMPGLLRRNREDALVLRGSRDVVAEEMGGEASDRRQPAVTRRRCVVAHGLDVVEEREYLVGLHILDAEIGNRAMKSVGKEDEEQPQRVGVGAQGMSARTAYAP